MDKILKMIGDLEDKKKDLVARSNILVRETYKIRRLQMDKILKMIGDLEDKKKDLVARSNILVRETYKIGEDINDVEMEIDDLEKEGREKYGSKFSKAINEQDIRKYDTGRLSYGSDGMDKLGVILSEVAEGVKDKLNG
jgi:hypothetical protein